MGVPRQGKRQKTFIDRLDVLEAGLVPWPKSGAVACLDASVFYEINWKKKKWQRQRWQMQRGHVLESSSSWTYESRARRTLAQTIAKL